MLDSDLGYRRDWRDFVLIHSGQQEITVSYCTFRTALLCLIGTFSITLLIAIIFILLREGPPPLTRKDMVCEVRECQEHATLVARTLNRTLDPCQDFSAFVCSGWRPLVDYSDSVEVDARVRWTTSLVAQLNEGRAGLKIMNKPEALYRTCTLRSLTDVANATRELAAFMNQLGLPWPHRPPKPADPIDLLVKLSFVWDLPSWIRLSLVPGPKAQQRVVLRPAPPAYESQNDLSRLGDPRRFRDYWAAFYRAFSGRLAEFDEARVERFRLMESEIAGSFRQLAVADTQTPALTTLGVLAEGTPYSWAAALNRHVQTHSKLTDSDEVLLSDSRLRGTLSDLLERFGEDIQEHLGWAFVQKRGERLPLRGAVPGEPFPEPVRELVRMHARDRGRVRRAPSGPLAPEHLQPPRAAPPRRPTEWRPGSCGPAPARCRLAIAGQRHAPRVTSAPATAHRPRLAPQAFPQRAGAAPGVPALPEHGLLVRRNVDQVPAPTQRLARGRRGVPPRAAQAAALRLWAAGAVRPALQQCIGRHRRIGCTLLLRLRHTGNVVRRLGVGVRARGGARHEPANRADDAAQSLGLARGRQRIGSVRAQRVSLGPTELGAGRDGAHLRHVAVPGRRLVPQGYQLHVGSDSLHHCLPCDVQERLPRKKNSTWLQRCYALSPEGCETGQVEGT
ncbi:uncharacterized protein [Dermacentor albipictus]|uniref:uncharacterized protein isoform X3 n=1 Tax=Dermacentor albipictus TaxID=60249 RepID=UPI0031FD726D